MKLSETGVRRPVATLMAFVAVFLLGCIAWQRLAVDMMPEIESPSISVFTRWDGASTEDVEQQITRVIESALGSVTDLDEITSTTSEGVSRVTCKFKWGTDLSQCNSFFLVAPGKTHWWGYVRWYVYDALPYFFHEGQ